MGLAVVAPVTGRLPGVVGVLSPGATVRCVVAAVDPRGNVAFGDAGAPDGVGRAEIAAPGLVAPVLCTGRGIPLWLAGTTGVAGEVAVLAAGFNAGFCAAFWTAGRTVRPGAVPPAARAVSVWGPDWLFAAAAGSEVRGREARSRPTASSSTVLRFVFTSTPSLRSWSIASPTLRFSSLASCPTRIFAT